MDQFCSELVANSESKWFLSALREWEHVETFLEEEEGTCICGHVIKEHCIIQNMINRKKLTVGNHCVKKFMNLDISNTLMPSAGSGKTSLSLLIRRACGKL